ncbi:glycosyltransferase family 2 protein [Sphingomonas sp. HITSZ_GF]|uniref:glycosyltransferase family 2 protein n=1 Tax=Sphingomonas sp. HITSZ_GF TaxID=3037247 RepID=UPI00240E26EE|nr:glycosyltransferase family 2 protein [Sphingomonas sp. HITSZ_GF]MDG2535775.1 glycosyltransferase family 2 protein [Sphingomonas sp. HITSZ_GF]
MKFSIVTISFNQAPYLERAIQSVLSQKSVDVEYIVVDPGSTDGSREIIERYRDRIAKVIFEKDTGPGDGLNKGLAAATGTLFGYINADDELLPDALAEAAAFLEAHPEIDVAYGKGYFVDEQGKRTKHLIPSKTVTPQAYADGLTFIVQQSAFMRTEALRAAGGFNVDNRTCWDAEAFLDMALRGSRFARVWRDWGLFRLYPNSITGSGTNRERYLADCARMFAKVHGRPPAAADHLRAKLLRPLHLASDPKRVLAKLTS